MHELQLVSLKFLRFTSVVCNRVTSATSSWWPLVMLHSIVLRNVSYATLQTSTGLPKIWKTKRKSLQNTCSWDTNVHVVSGPDVAAWLKMRRGFQARCSWSWLLFTVLC